MITSFKEKLEKIPARFWSLVLNILLSSISILVLVCVLEILFPYFIRFVPLRYQYYPDSNFWILGLNSKDDMLPKSKYIAIFGDSYAKGAGDWAYSLGKWSNGPYSSAHLLHQETGEDVVSFGQNGAGSVRGLVLNPSDAFKNIRSRFTLKDPDVIVYYLYGGNDFSDNLLEINLEKYGYLNKSVDDNLTLNREYFDRLLNDYTNKNVYTFSGFFKNHLLFFRSIHTIVSERYNSLFANKGINESEITKQKDEKDKTNIIINGSIETIPGSLQSPALDLTPKELELSISIFEESLKWTHNKFPSSKIIIVYIPSVLESYTLVPNKSVKVEVFKSDRNSVYKSEDISQRSNYIVSRIDEISKKFGVKFVDARGDIKKATQSQIIHGPIDWKHFNKIGYEVLTSIVVKALKK